MREKARIQRILSIIERIWKLQPDVRFNQLIANLQSLYSHRNHDYGKRKVTEKWDSGEVESSYLDFFYLEDTEWESFLKSLIENEGPDKSVEHKDKYTNDIVNDAIAVSKLILAGKTVGEITEASGLSPKYIEKIKTDLLEGTNLEQLMKEFASYKKKPEEQKSDDAVILNSQFIPAVSLEECTHFYIEENDEERLSVVNMINNKLYSVYYDSNEDDYYVINEKGERCYSVDAIIKVKMLKRVD